MEGLVGRLFDRVWFSVVQTLEHKVGKYIYATGRFDISIKFEGFKKNLFSYNSLNIVLSNNSDI